MRQHLEAKIRELEGRHGELTTGQMGRASHWRKTAFQACHPVLSRAQARNLRKAAADIDIWRGGLERVFGRNEFNFYHPLYFLHYLDKAGFLEFNPYEGKLYKELYKSSSTLNQVYDNNSTAQNRADRKIDLPDTWKVINNPGFAPYFGKGKGINGYGRVTGLFNEDYMDVLDRYKIEREYYYHFGVDFEGTGKANNEIHSFIYGRIIAKCWVSTNGRCLLVQSHANNNLYMLCHLSKYSENLNEGDSIFPGQCVAYVGKSGVKDSIYSNEAFAYYHLHVSVIKYSETVMDKKDIFNIAETTPKMAVIDGVQSNEEFFDLLNKEYVDPFNYEFEYGGVKFK